MKETALDLARRLRSAVRSARGRANPGVRYVIEGGDWSVDRDGEAITARLAEATDVPVTTTRRPSAHHHQVVHFGSVWPYLGSLGDLPDSNRVAVTLFHGHPDLDDHYEEAYETLRDRREDLDAVVVSCGIMEERLTDFGLPADLVTRIPLGVDTERFRPPSEAERAAVRERLRIPDGALCVGSFQKDGEGWGEGREPKLVKGPDLLLEVLEHLHREREVFVLLTGPARGYVKQGLEEVGIPYRHDFLEDYADLAAYYRALDAYLVTSREEGGPKSVLEATASGVPLVTTRVGMVPDVLEDGEHALVADPESLSQLVRAVEAVAEDPELRQRLAKRGRARALEFDWDRIARRYWEEVYRPLLAELPASPIGGTGP